jgi:NADPH:quinone reductase-like Zn-dependent oxidoreductase
MKVLVLGGSGRVGFTLISLLKRHFNCRVTTTTSQQNLQKILDLGFPKEDVIDHAQVTQLRGGYDAVFDTQGTAQSEAVCVAQLRNGGAYVTFNGLLVRHADSRGMTGLVQGIRESTCKRANMARDARGIRYGYALFSPSGENLKTLMGMADKGVVKADVDKVFSLDQIAQAYDYCVEASGSGKVVINVAGES